MPNWVKTKLKFLDITDEEFNKVVDKYTTEKEDKGRALDFEKIVPMPENIYRGSLGPREKELYGENNWYDWSIENWGTKWNSCYNSIDYDEHVFEFETAWTFAEPIVSKLAAVTGNAIEASFADEDYGHNCDVVYFDENGGADYQDIPDYSDEAWDVIEELWGVTKEECEEE